MMTKRHCICLFSVTLVVIRNPSTRLRQPPYFVLRPSPIEISSLDTSRRVLTAHHKSENPLAEFVQSFELWCWATGVKCSHHPTSCLYNPCTEGALFRSLLRSRPGLDRDSCLRLGFIQMMTVTSRANRRSGTRRHHCAKAYFNIINEVTLTGFLPFSVGKMRAPLDLPCAAAK